MSELLTFAAVGFRHIVDVAAVDHILFLIALAAIYERKNWRDLFWVVTAFTVGHSVTLALAVAGVLVFPASIVEFLIPVTIVVTGVENLRTQVVNQARRSTRHRAYRALLAGVFGLVHGAGFANYLRAMFVDALAVPLLGFNVGIELGQILVLAVAGAALLAMDWVIDRVRRPSVSWSASRLRLVAVSSLVTIVAMHWASERAPW